MVLLSLSGLVVGFGGVSLREAPIDGRMRATTVPDPSEPQNRALGPTRAFPEPGMRHFGGLICRFGASRIRTCLPPLIRVVQKSGHPVLWSIDPMHGNTITTDEGYKTRHFDASLDEVRESFAIHAEHGTIVGGIHLELTGNNVTECIGGAGGLSSTDLAKAYESNVDPRLNYEQAMEIAFLIAGRGRES